MSKTQNQDTAALPAATAQATPANPPGLKKYRLKDPDTGGLALPGRWIKRAHLTDELVDKNPSLAVHFEKVE